jgi:hypothetical protein
VLCSVRWSAEILLVMVGLCLWYTAEMVVVMIVSGCSLTDIHFCFLGLGWLDDVATLMRVVARG